MTKKELLCGLTLSGMLATSSGFFLLTTLKAGAQDNPQRETIQATAMGQQRASGKMFSVTVNIESYSTPADQKVLSDAFKNGGN